MAVYQQRLCFIPYFFLESFTLIDQHQTQRCRFRYVTWGIEGVEAISILKPSSHCPGLAPWYVPDGGPGNTMLTR